ncbi:MAG TPA: hypothetical protein VGR69_08525 [Candidatus Rubrimentiphilum sp.]|nr:hypothetical protein [Candidatus Rubrimentiphilum sp.]
MEIAQLVDIALTIVIFAGVVMMVVGLWRKNELLNAYGTIVMMLGLGVQSWFLHYPTWPLVAIAAGLLVILYAARVFRLINPPAE